MVYVLSLSTFAIVLHSYQLGRSPILFRNYLRALEAQIVTPMMRLSMFHFTPERDALVGTRSIFLHYTYMREPGIETIRFVECSAVKPRSTICFHESPSNLFISHMKHSVLCIACATHTAGHLHLPQTVHGCTLLEPTLRRLGELTWFRSFYPLPFLTLLAPVKPNRCMHDASGHTFASSSFPYSTNVLHIIHIPKLFDFNP